MRTIFLLKDLSILNTRDMSDREKYMLELFPVALHNRREARPSTLHSASFFQTVWGKMIALLLVVTAIALPVLSLVPDGPLAGTDAMKFFFVCTPLALYAAYRAFVQRT